MKRFAWSILLFFMTTLLWPVKFNHGASGVSIWFPDHWKVNRQRGVIQAMSPDGGAFAMFKALANVRSIQQAVSLYPRHLGGQVRNYQATRQWKRFTRKGLSFAPFTGYGVVRGARWRIDAILVQTPRGVALLVQRNVAGSEAKYKIPFTNIVESIKPL